MDLLTCFHFGPHPDFDLLIIQLRALSPFHNNNCVQSQIRDKRERQRKLFL